MQPTSKQSSLCMTRAVILIALIAESTFIINIIIKTANPPSRLSVSVIAVINKT